MPKFEIVENTIIRTPLLPENTSLNRDNILSLFKTNATVRTSIFYASTSLYASLINLDIDQSDKEKVMGSLYKYVARMSTRCTPFGLFAAVNVLPFSNTNIGQAQSDENLTVRLKLDSRSLTELLRSIAPALGNNARYTINSTGFINGSYFIYQLCQINNGKRRYSNQKVEVDIYLNQVLQHGKEFVSLEILFNSLKELDSTLNHEDVQEYFEDLIKSQILISELEPNITGENYLDRIIGKRLVTDTPLNLLKQTQLQLNQLNSTKQISVEKLKNIHSVIVKKFNAQINEQNFFQVDAAKTLKIKDSQAPHNLNVELNELFNFFYDNRGVQEDPRSHFSVFRNKFKSRYSNKAVPLSLVLDSELGLGYPIDSVQKETKLTSRIPLIKNSAENLNVELSVLQQRIFKTLINEKDLDEIDLSEMPPYSINSKLKYLPFLFSSLISFVENDTILIKEIQSRNAIDMMARFAGIDPDVDNHIEEIANLENENYENNGLVVAELCHFPFEERLANILIRPDYRPYEIPYYTLSTKESGRQIRVKDLFLYLNATTDQFMIYSKELKKHIIITHSNALNTSVAINPVFKFLVDLQFQQRPNLHFSLGRLASLFKKLPRIRFKNFILSRKQWTFNSRDIMNLKNSNEIRKWRSESGVDSKVLLKKLSQELYIDFDLDLSIQVLLHAIKNLKEFTLIEFLQTDSKYSIKDHNNNSFSNECLITSKFTPDSTDLFQLKPNKNVLNIIPTQGNIFLDGEWICHNIYCGIFAANEILKGFSKLVSTEKWFFIRYHDNNGFHLRIRFKSSSEEGKDNFRKKVLHFFDSLYSQGIITNINQVIYEREIDRYGISNLDDCELLFCADSVFYSSLIRNSNQISIEDNLWKIAILSLDYLLENLNMTVEQKMNFTERGKTSFGKEFNLDKRIIKTKLNDKYKTLRLSMIELFSSKNMDKEIALVKQLLESRSKMTKESISRIDNQNSAVLHSVFHMNCNRLFLTDGRFNEFVVYFIAHRHYTSIYHKNKLKKV